MHGSKWVISGYYGLLSPQIEYTRIETKEELHNSRCTNSLKLLVSAAFGEDYLQPAISIFRKKINGKYRLG